MCFDKVSKGHAVALVPCAPPLAVRLWHYAAGHAVSFWRGRHRVVVVVVLAGCGDADEPSQHTPEVSDPGPIHVHGLGINPADGALFVATHTGLFRAGPGERSAKRVVDRFQDTMGFTVTGPDRFLGSGHPDGREGCRPSSA
jgi:hypothetical protein